MKKVIFGTALASMALLSACSSDNELANVETTANNAIGFHVVGNKAETRANIINSTKDLEKTDFNVFAFTRNEDGTDGTIFMGEKANQLGQKGIKIVHKSGEWDYANDADIHYWPANTALNFYAVSPGSFEKVEENVEMSNVYGWNISNNTKTISYSPLDEYAGRTDKKNLDVMYAITENQTQKPNGGKVKFTFKHILSQVAFKAKTQLENMEVEINTIKIHNPWTKGTYTLPTTSSEKGTWALTDPTIGSKRGAFTVVKDKSISVTSKGTATEISVDGPMLFVPQTLTAWDVKKTKGDADKAGESYLEITCKIKQDGVYVFAPEGNYGTLYVPFGPTWEQGKRYTYTLIFGGGYDEYGLPILQPINFEAETTTWEDDIKNNNNGNDINIDK